MQESFVTVVPPAADFPPPRTLRLPRSKHCAAVALITPPVVHVGFAGSRSLFDKAAHPEYRGDREHEVYEVFVTYLQQLRTVPGLSDHARGGVTHAGVDSQLVLAPQIHEYFVSTFDPSVSLSSTAP